MRAHAVAEQADSRDPVDGREGKFGAPLIGGVNATQLILPLALAPVVLVRIRRDGDVALRGDARQHVGVARRRTPHAVGERDEGVTLRGTRVCWVHGQRRRVVDGPGAVGQAVVHPAVAVESLRRHVNAQCWRGARCHEQQRERRPRCHEHQRERRPHLDKKGTTSNASPTYS